jgi:hypothetical protein
MRTIYLLAAGAISLSLSPQSLAADFADNLKKHQLNPGQIAEKCKPPFKPKWIW